MIPFFFYPILNSYIFYTYIYIYITEEKRNSFGQEFLFRGSRGHVRDKAHRTLAHHIMGWATAFSSAHIIPETGRWIGSSLGWGKNHVDQSVPCASTHVVHLNLPDFQLNAHVDKHIVNQCPPHVQSPPPSILCTYWLKGQKKKRSNFG